MTVTAVDDPGDPRLAPFRAVRERDLARGDGLFVAEGEVVVRTLLSAGSRFRTRSLLVADNAAGRRVATETGDDVPVYLAGRAVMDEVVGFPIHRGVLALAERRPPEAPAALIPAPGPALILVLLGLANHDNVGGAFRNAAAFGADAVLLDRTCCDPLYRKAIRVSCGAALLVPFARGGDPEDILAALRAADVEVVALTPSSRTRIEEMRWPRRVALVVGQEGRGLSDAVLGLCRPVRIAMRRGFDSLNVATAAGIALHAARVASGARDD